jgi:hypothetical protein
MERSDDVWDDAHLEWSDEVLGEFQSTVYGSD